MSEAGSDGAARGPQPKYEVHSLRPCRRIGPDDQERVDIIVEIVQRRKAWYDAAAQAKLDDAKSSYDQKAYESMREDFYFRGGCTLVIDPESGAVRYAIRKRIDDADRLRKEIAYRQHDAVASLRATYFHLRGYNPFAMLHAEE